jgi:hypothetical protein
MRNHAGVTLVACLVAGTCLCLPSCVNLSPVTTRPAERPAPLLREPADFLEQAVLVVAVELPLPRVELGEAERDLAAPREEGAPAAAVPVPVAYKPGATTTLVAPLSGEAEPTGRPMTAPRVSLLAPSAPVVEISLRAGTEPVVLVRSVAQNAALAAASVESPSVPPPTVRQSPARSAAPVPTPPPTPSPAPKPAPKPAAAAQPAAAAPKPVVSASASPAASASASPAGRTVRAEAVVSPAPAPSTAAATPPAAAAPDRVVYARPNDDVEIVLTGEGWVLLGIDGPTFAAGSAGLRFVRRDLAKDRTVFAFHAERLGEYAVSFQRQQLSTGMLDASRAQVKVVQPDELAATIGSQGGSGGSSSVAIEGDRVVARAAADRLYALGLDKAALAEYRKLAADSSGDPVVTGKIADLAEKLGNPTDALAQWSSLASLPEYRERAVAGIVRAAASLGDGGRIASNLDALYKIRGFPVNRELVEVARYAERASDSVLELTALEEYLSRYPAGGELDEVYYRLGLLLEKAWEGRDLKRSRECYEAVVSQYPTSAFALSAGDRIDYLKRHFFYVR